MSANNNNTKIGHSLTLLYVAVAGIAFLIMVDHVYRTSLVRDNELKLNAAASILQHHLTVKLNQLILTANDLRAFLISQPNPPDSRAFAAFAGTLRVHYPELDALVYVGPDRIIHDISPLGGNEQAIGLDLSKRPAAPLIEKAIRENQLTVDPPHIMSNGQLAVIVRIPIFRGKEFLGLAQAVLRIPDAIRSELGDIGSMFSIQLLDENGKLFWGEKRLEGQVLKRDVVVGKSAWTLAVASARAPKASVLVLSLIWGLGGLLVLFIMWSVRRDDCLRLALEAKAADATRELRLRNEELERQIHQRQEAEAQVRRSVQSLREAQRLVHLGNWERDIANDRLYWSDELYRIFGFTPQSFEPTFEAFLSRVHPDDRDAVQQGLADALKLKLPYETEYRIVLPDGSTRYARASGIVEHDTEGKPLRSAGTVQDITAQKVYLKALEESEHKYRAVLENASDGILITSADGMILDANRRIQALLGYSRNELLTLHVSEIHPPEVMEEHTAAFASMLKHGSAITERLVLCKDGSVIPVEIAGARINLNSHKIALGIFRDISGRKRVEAELNEYRNHLEHLVEQRTAELVGLNSELESFSYSVSHDLRAPLRAIKGFSQALREDYSGQLDATGRDYLVRIKSATERMGRLIDDMLRLSRTIRAEMHQEHLLLSTMVQEILQELQVTDPERQVHTTVALEIYARGDPTLMRSLLQNLLSNAWKFTQHRADARIEFGILPDSVRSTYFVRDNGIGFEMRHARDVFKPFHRLHGPSDYEGSGIGLATVQRIVHRHGGQIVAESDPGQGTTFYFTLGQE